MASYVPESFDWQEVCPGIERFDFENPEFPLIYHAVKIDLTLAGLSAGTAGDDTTISNRHLEILTSRSEKTRDFASRENCVVAINATPFDKSGALVGLCRENGNDVSAPVARYAALAFGADGSARIFSSQMDAELEDFDYVYGGFFTVLEHGEVRRDFIRRHTSRSGAGLSADGTKLYLLVAEGEQSHKSMGLSYPQCGEIFKAMGCTDALEFDGGGSAELCINGKSVLSYTVHRVHGNCFGFKVK